LIGGILEKDLPISWHLIGTIQKNKLVRDVYSIKENISVKLNFVPKTAYIISPMGEKVDLNLKIKGKNYELTATLKEGIIIGNYTLVVDNYTKTIAIDYYRINAKYTNDSIVGTVDYYVKSPIYVNYILYPSGKTGNISIKNGTFKIPINTTGQLSKVVLICNGYRAEIKIDDELEKIKIKKIVSYDPVNKNIIIKMEGGRNEIREQLKKYSNFYIKLEFGDKETGIVAKVNHRYPLSSESEMW
jgi:hypothetical protein